jgi:acyl-CoA thioesterase FadM
MTYHKPINSPQIVVIRGKVAKREGKKLLVKGSIEDSEGTVLTEAEALWLTVNKGLKWAKL